MTRLGIAAFIVALSLASFSGAAKAGIRGVAPDTVVVRVTNPTDRYGTLFATCDGFSLSLGLIEPGGTTTLTPKIADIQCDSPSGRFGVALSGGGLIHWATSILDLDDPGLAGLLLCLGQSDSTLYRISKPHEVPPVCAGSPPSVLPPPSVVRPLIA